MLLGVVTQFPNESHGVQGAGGLLPPALPTARGNSRSNPAVPTSSSNDLAGSRSRHFHSIKSFIKSSVGSISGVGRYLYGRGADGTSLDSSSHKVRRSPAHGPRKEVLPDEFRALRESIGLSQADAADKVWYSAKTIHR